MKKALYLITFMLLFGVTHGADFCGSFGEYRTQIRRKMDISQTNTGYASDSTLNQFVREAVVQLVPIIKGYTKTAVVTTVYKDNSYSIDSTITNIESVEWSYNDSIKSFVYVPKSQWYQMEHKETGNKDGYEKRPSYYDFTDSYLYLYPVPTKSGDSIIITGTGKIASLAASDNLSNIPQKYRGAILNYAVYQLAKSKGHPLWESFYRDYVESVTMLTGGKVETTK